MNDVELTLLEVQNEASRQRAEMFARLVLATSRLVSRPFRRNSGQAA